MSPVEFGRDDYGAPAFVSGGSCDWCEAPLPEAGVFIVSKYDPDGEQFERDVLCSDCHAYGPPQSARRERIELAWKITPQMGLLERLCWSLLRRVAR